MVVMYFRAHGAHEGAPAASQVVSKKVALQRYVVVGASLDSSAQFVYVVGLAVCCVIFFVTFCSSSCSLFFVIYIDLPFQ